MASKLDKAEAAFNTFERAQSVFEKGKQLLKGMTKTQIETKMVPVHSGLARSIGKHASQEVLDLDQNMKVALAGVIIKLEEIPEPREWKVVTHAMMTSQVVVEKGDKITRSDTFTKEGSGWLKVTESRNDKTVNEAKAWFEKFINDDDILHDMQMDVKFMYDIVAKTGLAFESLVQLFYQSKKYECTFIEVAVLRYPVLKNPHFKLYRIQLRAWSNATRILFKVTNKNGLAVELSTQIYVPRKSVLDSLNKATKEGAAALVDKSFTEDAATTPAAA